MVTMKQPKAMALALRANRDEVLLNIATLFYFTTLIGLAPFIPQLAVDLGAQEEQVALLAPLYAVTAIMLRPLTGVLSDKGFTRHLLVTGSLLNLASQILYATSGSIVHVYLARLIQGSALALFIPASLHAASLGSDAVASRNLASRSIMVGLGATMGPAIGGFLLEIDGWFLLFGVGGFLSFLSLVLSAMWRHPNMLPKTGKRTGRGLVTGLKNRLFMLSSLALFLFAAFYMSIVLFLPALHRELGLGNAVIALFFTIVSFTNLVSRVIFTKITQRQGPLTVSIVGVMLVILGVELVAINPADPAIVYVAPLVGSGLGLLVPGLQILALTSVPIERRGMAASIYTVMFDAASLIGPPLIALIAGNYVESIRLAALIMPISITPLLLARLYMSQDVFGKRWVPSGNS